MREPLKSSRSIGRGTRKGEAGGELNWELQATRKERPEWKKRWWTQAGRDSVVRRKRTEESPKAVVVKDTLNVRGVR